VVDKSAEIGADVEIGPFAYVGDGVVIGDRCVLEPHAVLQGPMVIGAGCRVCSGAVLGGDPQVKGKEGPFGGLRIGAGNVFRECSTVHRSMFPDKETDIGDGCYFMAGAHAGHDCLLGDNVIITNQSMLAGHVTVGDGVYLSGLCGVHQFCRIGELAMMAGGSIITQDLPPYCISVGSRPARLGGLNAVGMRRAGVTSEARKALKAAYRILFRSEDPLPERLARVDSDQPEVRRLVEFVKASERGVVGVAGE
jgi:UDP-N-acetylglucosamine acyltransferase